MNKFVKIPALAIMTAATLSFAACSDDDDNSGKQEGEQGSGQEQQLTEKESALKLVIEEYVNNTVVPTYHGLADAALLLAEQCEAMCEAGPEGLTEDMVKEAGRRWIEARRYWELSEAWLFGPAAIYNIDPHIDTWPLDKTAMDRMLNNAGQMEQMYDRESAANYVGNNLGQGLLGFHAVEYMLFEPADDTATTTLPRPVSRFTSNELFYLAAVADDLRNQCLRLEAAWSDEGTVDDNKMEILADAELDDVDFYGEEMKNAGLAGSRYRSYAAAVQDLIIGAQDIADEVGSQKIGNPIGSGVEADPDYIESPYALNSITDFIDNIRSVRHAYMGYQPYGNEVENNIQPCTHTLSAYIANIDSDLDARVKQAIEDAIEAISAMQEPFASTSQQAAYRTINQNAVDACDALQDILDEVIEAVQND